MILDVVIIMDIATARKLLSSPEGSCRASTSRRTTRTPIEAVAAAIETGDPGIDARSMHGVPGQLRRW